MNVRSYISSLFRFSLALAISIQIAIGAVPLRSMAASNTGSPSEASGIGRALGANKAQLLAAEKAGKAIANGNFNSVDYDKDLFHIAGGLSKDGQVIQIVGGQRYALNQPQSEIPPVSFTALKVRFDKPTQSLIFEAYIGQNDEGVGGKLVATHTIPNLDIKTMIRDAELLQYIDSNGKLNAIAMDIVANSIFKTPIPIFKNLWHDRSGQTASSEYSLKFASQGIKPLSSFKDMIIPIDEQGNPIVNAGDLIVSKNGTPIGVFSRKVTYGFIQEGLKGLVKLGALIFPANMSQERMRALSTDLTMLEQIDNIETSSETTPALVRDALLHFNEKRMQALDSSANLQNIRSHRQFQRLDDLNQWQAIYDRIIEKAKATDNDLRKRLGQKPKNIEMQKQAENLRKALSEGDFTNSWRDLYPQKTTSSFKSMVREYATPVAFVAATIASFGFVSVYDQVQTLRDIQAFSWLYQQIPDVVRDEYYKNPLLISTMSVLAMWPAGEMAGAAFARGIKFLAEKTKNMNTKVSHSIQDMARAWGGLSRWQVLTTTGARIRSITTSPIPRAVIANVLGQRSMVTAWNNNLSPWQKIAPDSAAGRKLGLTEPIRIGVGAPNQTDLRLKAQAIVAEKRDRANSLAFQIAVLVVAEEENIDPASMMMLLQGDTDVSKLNTIFSDKTLHLRHRLTQEKMATFLAAVDDGFFDGDITPESTIRLNEYIQVAKGYADKIKKEPKLLQSVRVGWTNTRNFLKEKRNLILNLGYADSLFLRKIVTNKFVSEQTKRAFIPDHIMVAVIYALYGDRANLLKPHDLAADPNGFLSTNAPHWADVGANTNAHWFSAAARKALIYQQVKPENTNNYEPFEYAILNASDRPEPFTKSFMNWFRVLDPRQSDIGTTAWKGFQKSMTTIQAAWLTNLFFRMGLGHQSLGDATAGFLLMIFAGQWTYGFPWDYIEKGNYIEEERIEDMKLEFRQAMTVINEAAHERDPQVAATKGRDGYTKLMALYEKYNPKALAAVPSNPNMDKYFGVAAKLHLAILSGDQTLIEKTKAELKTALVAGGAGVPELEVMNAQGLYDYALQATPIYTEAHWATAWVSTTVFGAILTTLLSIPLAVSAFHPEWKTVAMWAVGSTLAYVGYYNLLKKDGWLAAGLNKIEPLVKNAAQAAKNTVSKPKPVVTIQPDLAKGVSTLCDSYLTK